MNSLSNAALLLLQLGSGWNLLLVLSLILACPLGMWIMMLACPIFCTSDELV